MIYAKISFLNLFFIAKFSTPFPSDKVDCNALYDEYFISLFGNFILPLLCFKLKLVVISLRAGWFGSWLYGRNNENPYGEMNGENTDIEDYKQKPGVRRVTLYVANSQLSVSSALLQMYKLSYCPYCDEPWRTATVLFWLLHYYMETKLFSLLF